MSGATTVLACRAADGSLAYRIERASSTSTGAVAGRVAGRPAVRLAADGSGTLIALGTDGLLYASPLTSGGSPGPFARLSGSGSGVSASAAAPLLVAAGDIACAPSDPSYGTGLPGACRQTATAELAAATGPDGVAPLGDAQYSSGALADFRTSYAASWGRLLAQTRPAPGNHEYVTPGAAGYFDYFGARSGDRAKGYYSYDLGGWHVVVLNSNCTYVSCARGSAQEQWLRADLAASGRRCTLAYWHHPRWSSGPHGDSAATAAFWQALYDARADIVLAGHDHDYERFARMRPDGTANADGLRSWVVGTGGKEHYAFPGAARPGSLVRDDTHFGVLALTLGTDGYGWRFATETGGTGDSGTGTCRT